LGVIALIEVAIGRHSHTWYCYLSDSSVSKLLSLIGDELLNFDKHRDQAMLFLCIEGIGQSNGKESFGTPRAQRVIRRSALRPRKRGRCVGGITMATVSESHISDREISDVEFEQLLQKTYEMVQSQKPLEPSAESTSWT
jgi:hypothetical protein